MGVLKLEEHPSGMNLIVLFVVRTCCTLDKHQTDCASRRTVCWL